MNDELIERAKEEFNKIKDTLVQYDLEKTWILAYIAGFNLCNKLGIA